MIWLLLLLAAYLLAILGIAWLSLHPFRTPIFISPGALGVSQEVVEFLSQDGTQLRGWWTETAGSNRIAVLAHGYMMNRCELVPLGVRLANMGFSTLVFDFRAHGKSGGKKCTLGFKETDDVLAAAKFARQKQPESQVVLIGSSMGAAACARALACDPAIADGLILDSAYSKLPSAILGWWRFLGGKLLMVLLSPCVVVAAPLARFNPFKVDIAQSLRQIFKPVLLLHGDCDTLALPSEAVRNKEAAAGPVELVWLPTCGHSEGRWVHPDIYHRGVDHFLETLEVARTPAEPLSRNV